MSEAQEAAAAVDTSLEEALEAVLVKYGVAQRGLRAPGLPEDGTAFADRGDLASDLAAAARARSAPPAPPDFPPYVLIEWLKVGPQDIIRVVGASYDEGEAHHMGQAMADVGLKIWWVDLVGTEGEGPTVNRYVGQPHAAWLFAKTIDATGRGAGDDLTERGQ